MSSFTHRGALAIGCLLAGVVEVSAQALPPPTNTNLRWLAYYKATTNARGDFIDHVFTYTNMYIADPSAYGCSWQTGFHADMGRAVNAGKRIMLLAGSFPLCGNTVTPFEIVAQAADFWSSVDIAVCRDDVGATATAADVNGWIAEVRNAMNANNIFNNPYFMVEFSLDGARNSSGISASDLNVVGVELYNFGLLLPPGDPDRATNVRYLDFYIPGVKNRARYAGKQVVLTMQAYDVNGSWTNTSTLEVLQDPVYMNAYADPVVMAITMFAYSRTGGTVDYPLLETHHRLIASAMRIASYQNPGVEINDMAPASGVRGCTNFVAWPPVFKPDHSSCLTHCTANNANACEWFQNTGDCYVEFGSDCYVDTTAFGGWWALVLKGQ
jgi:hypothetical protein